MSYTFDSTGPSERNLPLGGAGPMVVGLSRMSTLLAKAVLKSSKINLLIRAAFSKYCLPLTIKEKQNLILTSQN